MVQSDFGLTYLHFLEVVLVEVIRVLCDDADVKYRKILKN